MCTQAHTKHLLKFFADETCRYLGYPWAFTWEKTRYLESPDYVSTGKELVMRELYIESSSTGVRWTRGQDACLDHDYSLISVECETGK